ncbi:MAG TPA: AsmA family protein [Bryobacteraceae bacterium]|nr:AsmA family protein [Bryobacteraceae bacterium]
MKKILLGTGIVVIALLAAAVTYLTLMDVNQFRPQVQAAIQNQLGRPVSLGTMHLRMVPLSIRIADVSIGEDPTFRTCRPFATAGDVSLAVSLFPLLRKQLHIDSFVLRQPAIELVQTASGKWNFSSIGSKTDSGTGAGSGGGLSIAELRVEDGKLAVGELGKKRSVYEHIGIGLTDFAPGRPFRLSLGAILPGTSSESLRVEATGGPLGPESTPLHGFIEVRKAGIAALRQFLAAGAAGADGILDGRIDFDLKNSAMNARPRLSIDKVKVAGKDLGRGLKIEGDLQHNLDTGVMSIPGLRLAAGNVPLTISGEVDTRNSRMDVSARADGAPLAELLTAAAAFGGTEITGSGRLNLDVRMRGSYDRVSDIEYLGQGMLRDAAFNLPELTQPLKVPAANLKLAGKSAAVEGVVASLGGSTLRGGMTLDNFAAASLSAGFNLSVDKLDLTELQQIMRSGTGSKAKGAASAKKSTFSAKGTLSAGRLIYTGLVLEQVRSECTYVNDVLTLSPLTAQVFGGTQKGAITVDMRSEPATVAMNTKLESVDAEKLLSATTSLKSALYGLLAASGNASMKLLPGTGATQSLNGDLAVRLTKGRLGGINLMNQLAGVGRFVGFAQQGEPFTDLVGLTGDLQVRNGIARTENLLLQLEGGSVGAAGTVNLVDESLNLRMTAVLDSAMSQKAGGSRVGGYLTSALVNSKGELVIPALVTGTFAKPRFAPDAARVAEMKLKNVLPAAGNLGTAASGIAGILKGDKSAGRSILDSLTGKQAAQPKEETATAPANEPAPATTTPPKRKGLLGALDELKKRTSQPAPAKPEAQTVPRP